jgi:hypothetical protein
MNITLKLLILLSNAIDNEDDHCIWLLSNEFNHSPHAEDIFNAMTQEEVLP